MNKLILTALSFFLLQGCFLRENPIKASMKSDNFLSEILKNKDEYEIQIAYTEITRDKYDEPVFRDFELQVDEEKYFYPASTVKLPLAILALQKIRKLQSQGIPLTPDTPFTVLFSENIIKKTDATHPNNKLTIAHLIKKIFFENHCPELH